MINNQTARQTRHGNMARVSKLALGAKSLPIRFMYKTVPEHAKDTGWRLFTGYESEAFLADFDNLEPFPLAPLVAKDPSLDPLLDSNAGSVWERLPGQAWQPVKDFKIPYDEVEVTVNRDMDDLLQPIWK